MPPRLYLAQPLQAGSTLDLPPGPSRHVQVLRLQPGDALTLFNGQGGEWSARVQGMGRKEVSVEVLAQDPAERELPHPVRLAIGMPANERMDAVIEKATELGVAAIQPLVCERSVLRLHGERAERRQAHWQGVAIAACEQSGRTRLPEVAPVRTLAEWLSLRPVTLGEAAFVLHPRASAVQHLQPGPALFLSGPEGGLTDPEITMAEAAGFQMLSLGPRVLRADTAPLAVLAHLALASH